MSSNWGKYLTISIFGESHGSCIGVVINGLPPGEEVNMEELQKFLLRRTPGRTNYISSRQEDDKPQFISGLYQGHTTGTPLTAIIPNKDPRSVDYRDLEWCPRPGHADFTAAIRYNNAADFRGGGHNSGRLTAPLCVAGGIIMQILSRRGIYIGSHLSRIGKVEDKGFDPVNLTKDELLAPGQDMDFPVIEHSCWHKMRQEIDAAQSSEDSVGGMIEAAAIGVPAGLGSPIFDGAENRIASIILGIPGIRGVEFGTGMAAAGMTGSCHNDPFITVDGQIRTSSNNHGGILGGITSGMPIILRAAVKPTPSIAQTQNTVNLRNMQPAELRVLGRHDPCIAPRAMPAIEAALAIAILDLLIERQ